MLSKYVWDNIARKLLAQCFGRFWLASNEAIVLSLENCILPTVNKFHITRHNIAQSAQTSFLRETGCSFKYLVACCITGNNITEQSWLFLFNVGSGVHLRLAGQQGRGADIDWNITMFSASWTQTLTLFGRIGQLVYHIFLHVFSFYMLFSLGLKILRCQIIAAVLEVVIMTVDTQIKLWKGS